MGAGASVPCAVQQDQLYLCDGPMILGFANIDAKTLYCRERVRKAG